MTGNGADRDMARFTDWVYDNAATYPEVAAFMREHVKVRPADAPYAGRNFEARWPNLAALKSHAEDFGPAVSAAQIDTAWAAFPG